MIVCRILTHYQKNKNLFSKRYLDLKSYKYKSLENKIKKDLLVICKYDIYLSI